LLPDAIPLVDFLFRDKIERDLGAMLKKGVDATVARAICLHAARALAGADPFEIPEIERSLRGVAEELARPVGAVLTVIRIAVTGKKVTPPLFESIYALGQSRSMSRLTETAELVSAGNT
jgi:glutamyl-tRNA synthetase